LAQPFGLSHIEKRRKWRTDEIHDLDIQIEKSKKHLHSVNDEISSANALLNSYYMLCQHKKQEAENLNNEISRLETLVSRFKSNDKEYFKIKKAVEEEVSKFLVDGKELLQFALVSVIEAIRRNPDTYNNILTFNTSSSSATTPSQDSLLLHIEDYKDIILDEANRLNDMLLKHLTNSIMDNAAGASSSDPKLSSMFPRPNQDNTYRRIEEQGSFHNSEDDTAD
jgi:chromosome segregation ATPase